MTDWEKEKRDSQLAFINPDDSLEEAHESVDRFYTQLLAKGFIEPYLSNDRAIDQALDVDKREIDAAAEHDVKLWEEAHQEITHEPDIEPER